MDEAGLMANGYWGGRLNDIATTARRLAKLSQHYQDFKRESHASCSENKQMACLDCDGVLGFMKNCGNDIVVDTLAGWSCCLCGWLGADRGRERGRHKGRQGGDRLRLASGHTYRTTDRQTDRQIQLNRLRLAVGQTDRQTDRGIHHW